jgi:hypothetical protein
LATALLASPAAAQLPRLEFSVSGGIAMPVGGNPGPIGASGGDGFADGWSQGLSVGGGLGLSLPAGLGIGLRVDYSRFPLDEDNYLGSGGGTVSGGELSIIAFGAELRYTLSSLTPAQPYLTLGLMGLKLSDVDVSSSSASGSSQVQLTREGFAQDLGVAAGGGVALRAGGARLFAEVRAVIGTYSQASYLPVRAGLAFRL